MPNSKDKTYAVFSHPTNKKIIAELEKEGFRVFQFPPLESERITLSKESHFAISMLKSFDWLIFPDVLAVDYFLEILEENEIDFFEMDFIQVCALGEIVADRLRFAQLHADVIPISINPESVFSALSNYIGKENFAGLKFLVPQGISPKLKVKYLLSDQGAKITELPVYQTKNSRADEIIKLKILLEAGAIDEFVLTEPTDLVALKAYFDNESILITLNEIKISTINKNMFQNLKENGLKPSYF